MKTVTLDFDGKICKQGSQRLINIPTHLFKTLVENGIFSSDGMPKKVKQNFVVEIKML